MKLKERSLSCRSSHVKCSMKKLLNMLKELWLNLPVKTTSEGVRFWKIYWLLLKFFLTECSFSFVSFITNRRFFLTCLENIVYDDLLWRRDDFKDDVGHLKGWGKPRPHWRFFFGKIIHCSTLLTTLSSLRLSVGLVPTWVSWASCHRATVPSCTQGFFSWVFRGSKIFFSRVFYGSEIFSCGYFVGNSWIYK